MTVTCAMLLASVRLSKKKVSELKEEEAVLRTEAASPGQPSHLAAPMLEEAECLQDAAHRELLKANCMEKLFHGDVPTPQEAEAALQEGLLVLRALKEGGDYVSVHRLDPGIWEGTRSATGLKEAPFQYLLPSQQLPELAEPELTWDDNNPSAHSDRFIPHLQKLIELGGEESEWVDATRDPQLLSYAGLANLGYNFEASTDVLVATRSAVRAHRPEMGARVLFDIRRVVTGAEIIDAEARLLLANLHAPDEKPVMVVSNLQSQWFLLWMDDIKIHRCRFETRASAVKVINDLMAHTISHPEAGPMEVSNYAAAMFQAVTARWSNVEISIMHRHRISAELAPRRAVA